MTKHAKNPKGRETSGRSKKAAVADLQNANAKKHLPIFGQSYQEPGDDQDRRKLESIFINLKGTKDLEEVVDKCGFSYEVLEDELTGGNSGKKYRERGMYHSVTGEPLGVVGTSFTQYQPAEALAAFDAVIKERKGQYQAGGYVRNGSRLFVIADFGGQVEVRKDDKIVNHLVLSTAFEGSGSTQVWELPERLWCANQLAVAISRTKAFYAIPHTTNVKQRVEDLLRGIGAGEKVFETFKEQVKRLNQIKLTKGLIDKMCDGIFGELVEADDGEELKGAQKSARTRQDELRAEIERLTMTGMGNIGETLFDAYNGVTEYITHRRGDDDKRMESVLFGSGRRMSQKAMEVAIALAK